MNVESKSQTRGSRDIRAHHRQEKYHKLNKAAVSKVGRQKVTLQGKDECQ